MLGPQSSALFVVLMVIFGALMWRMVAGHRIAFRVLVACLAFISAMLFGVAAVNKYYGYYQTWGAVATDFTSQGVNAAPQVPDVNFSPGSQQRQGYTLRLSVAGQRSHITRVVYVYLPPQYFHQRYKTYRFPVIELIHGQPGQPQDWINVVGVTDTLGHLVIAQLARPVVLVMPDANGGRSISLQCLNQVGGPPDLTYLTVDLPDEIAHVLRVQPPGSAWGVAGYSEGGFCAANMALRHRYRYGFAGVLSGYFKPFDNQLAHPSRHVSPFGGSRRLQQENTPLDEIQALQAGALTPQFWLGAGSDDKQAVANAKVFWQELRQRQAVVPLTLTPGGGHTMVTWRAEVSSMLKWMTHGLAQAAQQEPVARSRPATDVAERRR